MIELTEPLRQALDAAPNDPVPVVDPRTNQTYVLIRSEVYDRVKALLDPDDLEGVNVAALVGEAMREDDTNDPLLESYQKYKKDA
jgi:hypothetical protein